MEDQNKGRAQYAAIYPRCFAAKSLLIAALLGMLPSARAADVALGRTIAMNGANGVAACAACHGANGEGNAAAGFPRLAGVGVSYLEAQLAAFASGTRRNAVMQPVAQGLSPEARKAVSAYFASLPAPAGTNALGGEPASPADTGAWLATRGRWQQDLPACAQCHGSAGTGAGAVFPPLAGQPEAYIAAQLHAWREGTRPPGPLSLMQVVARKLSDADIAAVSAYYAGGKAMPQGAAGPSGPRHSEHSAGRDAGVAPAAPASAPIAKMFVPPAEDKMPDGEFGKTVKLGEQIFLHTGQYAGKYVGNDLSCVNCHTDAGRKADAGPLWAAYISYPAYRSKNGHVNTFAERLQGCFRFSMNGKVPPLGDPVFVALETYAHWLSTGAPVGETKIAGRGYPKLAPPPKPASYQRGAVVYEQRCAICHGAEGQGQSSGGKVVFPPLWGPRSFNWGAGMHDLQNAAGFVKANMPLGLGGTLTDQEAWDVARFVDGHERPQDPRFNGSVEETRAKYHNTPTSLYGVTVNGHLLGSESH